MLCFTTLPAGWGGLVLLLASLQACFIAVVLLQQQRLKRQHPLTKLSDQTGKYLLVAMSTSAAAVCRVCSARLIRLDFIKSRSLWSKPAAAHQCQIDAAASVAAAKQLQSAAATCCSIRANPASLPTPEQVSQLIRARRSIYPQHMTGDASMRVLDKL